MWDDFNLTGAQYRQYLDDMIALQELELLMSTGEAPPGSQEIVNRLYAQWVD